MPKGQQPIEIPKNSTGLYKDVGEQNEAKERALDETLAETFPASDPLSSDPAPIREEEPDRGQMAS